MYFVLINEEIFYIQMTVARENISFYVSLLCNPRYFFFFKVCNIMIELKSPWTSYVVKIMSDPFQNHLKQLRYLVASDN